MAITWEDCREAFKEDGSLRDIYVKGASVADWERLFRFLVDGEFNLSYTRDAKPANLPSHAAQILQDRSSSHNLMISIGNLTPNCHFFTEEEIELDIDPHEVHSQLELDLILSFMRNLGTLLSKEVILTEENSGDFVWFRYVPEGGEMHYEAADV